MNERIKELYEQSLIRETGKDHAGNPMLVIKQNPEKFAELMIGEVHYAIVVGGVQDLDILLEHFGVE